MARAAAPMFSGFRVETSSTATRSKDVKLFTLSSSPMSNSQSQKVDLQAMARQVMIEHGFEPDFSAAVQQQLQAIQSNNPVAAVGKNVRDLRGLLWSSIDNDTSRDLDQIEIAESLSGGQIKVMIGIADVDAFVAKNSAIDAHAAREATSVYTGVRVFPMLPEQLSTGLS